MNIIRIGIAGAASVVGLGAAFAFAPAKSFAPTVYVSFNQALGTFSYSVTPPPAALTCQIQTPDACTITTTIPVGTLNATANTNLPTEKLSSPGYINYISPGRVYK